ncbi:rhamnulokinase [Lysinibacillus sp. NPDC097287]|uniref:rhamnulokinase n=1 Tax=Lysinibacillus sp. NPDC097287 TaxID=3364144 RepID=UPI00382C5B28
MTHVAIDIGASSGRLLLGLVEDGKLKLQEVHRFPNCFAMQNGRATWNVERLLTEIIIGLEKVKKLGYDNITIGIDTWAVDYVLINENGERLQEAYCYRDHRTDTAIELMEAHISCKEIYNKTGIQIQNFNTCFQLLMEEKTLLAKAKYILLIPDYLAYRLTGVAVLEWTNASTMQLLNVTTQNFDEELLAIIGVEATQFAPLIKPGEKIGMLQNELFVDFDLPISKVIAVASHDTASAIAGTPSTQGNWAYLSSGTWSLLGIERQDPIITECSYVENYTNEWGVFNTYRVLKNIMGLWILQEVLKNYEQKYTLEQVILEASHVQPYQQFIDFNEERFLNPSNMIVEIKQYCQETGQSIPKTIGELAACIFSNLSIIYAIAIEHLQQITKYPINVLYVVGGGSKNHLLNQMTANMSQRKVYAGPSEATAIGNIMLQLIADGKFHSLEEARQFVHQSIEMQIFQPEKINAKLLIEQFKRQVMKERKYS